jgi:hypothetical protein
MTGAFVALICIHPIRCGHTLCSRVFSVLVVSFCGALGHYDGTAMAGTHTVPVHDLNNPFPPNSVH